MLIKVGEIKKSSVDVYLLVRNSALVILCVILCVKVINYVNCVMESKYHVHKAYFNKTHFHFPLNLHLNLPLIVKKKKKTGLNIKLKIEKQLLSPVVVWIKHFGLFH